MLRTKEVYNTSTDLEPRDWRFPLNDYALHGLLPDDPKESASIRWRSLRFYYDPTLKTLYHRSYDVILLRCLSNLEAQKVLKEAHDDICGAHQPGPKLKDRLHRLGYYWPSIIANAIQYARRCKACQIHADFIHQPLELLHPIVASWPFEAWGIDFVGPIGSSLTKGYRFILAIPDYFSKWAEDIPLVEVKTSNIVNFIKHLVIHWFGVPRRIIHNNGPQFVSQVFYRFCDRYRFRM